MGDYKEYKEVYTITELKKKFYWTLEFHSTLYNKLYPFQCFIYEYLYQSHTQMENVTVFTHE